MTYPQHALALVTGGSRGIGKAIVQHFAQAGVDVAFTYAKSVKPAEALVKELEHLEVNVLAIQADHTDPDVAETVVQRVKDAFQRPISILVNSAGVLNSAPIMEMQLADLDTDLNLSVRNVFTLTQAVVKHMPAGGRVVNVSSVLGERASFPGLVSYDTSRFAMLGFTRSLAWDLGEKNITVNAVLPGPINTDMNPQDSGGMEGFTAMKRYGQPEEVAKAVGFLASEGASYITGATLRVDGGMNA